MRIQLPVETWIEILDWLRRRDLIKKLDKLWDRQFTPIVQDWLHKYTRNVKLGKLWADKYGLHNGKWEKVPFAVVDMPANITGFKLINIRYLDSNVLAFLHRMSLLFRRNNTNIHLKIDLICHANELPTQTALRFLMPIFSSIESISFDHKPLQFFSANYPLALLNVKLLVISDPRHHQVSDQSEQILIDWLFTKCDDGQARILIFHWSNAGFPLFEKIRQCFLDPARQCACPFFVRILIYRYYDEVLLIPPNMQDTANVRTGEQLTFKKVKHGNWHYWLITNCPINTDMEWLNKKTTDVLEWKLCNQQQVIELEFLKISPQLYASEDAADQQQQSSGSGTKLI